MARRGESEGRGALGSVDMLPPIADHAVVEAIAQLRERRLPQTAIRDALNVRLQALGLEPVPRTTFYRWAKHGLTRGFAPRQAGPVPAAARDAGAAGPRPGSTFAACPCCGAPLVIVVARSLP